MDKRKKEQVEMENIAKTISTLPDEALEDVQMEVLKDTATEEYARKLEYLKREEELIKEEFEIMVYFKLNYFYFLKINLN